MKVFWLTPQFWLLGFMDGFSSTGLRDFYYNQAREYRLPLCRMSFGFGKFASIIWISTFGPWLGDTINESQVVAYYISLAVVSLLNISLFLYASSLPLYYMNSPREDEELMPTSINGAEGPVGTSNPAAGKTAIRPSGRGQDEPVDYTFDSNYHPPF